jgi:hypothetical protein
MIFVCRGYQVSLVGLAALLVILHHTQFCEKLHLLLNNYYVYTTIHPVNALHQGSAGAQGGVAGEEAKACSSQATVSTSGGNSLKCVISGFNIQIILRSAGDNLLVVPVTRTATSSRAFRSYRPTIWNALPSELHQLFNFDLIDPNLLFPL